MKLKSLLAGKARKYVASYLLNRTRLWALNIEAPNMKHLVLQSLTSEEQREIVHVWGRLGLKPYPLFYQMFKTIDEFNPKYLSDDLYYPVILRALNPDAYSKAFAHKAHLPFLFNEIPQAELLFVSVNGVVYNQQFEIIKKNYAIERLKSIERFIVKPTHDSSCGKGVRMVKVGEDIGAVLCEYGDDWIAQGVVPQSEETARFNPSSLNSFRFTTMFLNGETSTQSIIFKIGPAGAIVDNLGAGGIMVGVTANGELRDFGYDNKYNRYTETTTGIELKGVKFGFVPEVAKKMEYYHKRYFPSLGIVGWDVAINNQKSPVVIEANLNFPGIQFEQLAISTPIFGERTEEVVDFVVRHKQK